MDEPYEPLQIAAPTIAPVASTDLKPFSYRVRRFLGTLVPAAYLTKQILRGRWDTFILPVASILTVLSGPGYYLVTRLHSAPTGLPAVAGSFVLFASGAAVALTKHCWHSTLVSRETL